MTITGGLLANVCARGLLGCRENEQLPLLCSVQELKKRRESRAMRKEIIDGFLKIENVKDDRGFYYSLSLQIDHL